MENLEKGEMMYANRDAGITIHKGLFSSTIPVAIKSTFYHTARQASKALKEAFAMEALRHSNVLKLYDCFFELAVGGFTVTLVTELMASDLSAEIHRRSISRQYWTEEEILGILRRLVSALSHAEKLGFSHCDIKPQNIFLTDLKVKIGDFGSAVESFQPGQTSHTIRGSPFYLSPELRTAYVHFIESGDRYTAYDPVKSDVYSLGLTLLHMARLAPPDELANLETLEEQTKVLVGEVAYYPYLQPILTAMLAVSPESRPKFTTMEDYFQRFEKALEAASAQPVPTPSGNTPDRSEIAPDNQNTNCTGCGCGERTLIQQGLIPPYLRGMAAEGERYCSEACLARKANMRNGNVCVCGGGLDTTAIRLQCGHGFHPPCYSNLSHSDHSESSAILCSHCHLFSQRPSHPCTHQFGLSAELLASNWANQLRRNKSFAISTQRYVLAELEDELKRHSSCA